LNRQTGSDKRIACGLKLPSAKAAQALTLFALSNLWMARRRLPQPAT